MIELPPHRHPVRQPRHVQAFARQLVGDVMRRGLAIDRGSQSKDHFAHTARLDPAYQRCNAKVRGSDPVNRRQYAAKHMITPAESPAAFQCPEVRHVLYHADQRVVAPRQLAHRARLYRVIVSAGLALLDLCTRLCHRLSERLQ